jgi:hypothetical protein
MFGFSERMRFTNTTLDKVDAAKAVGEDRDRARGRRGMGMLESGMDAAKLSACDGVGFSQPYRVNSTGLAVACPEEGGSKLM